MNLTDFINKCRVERLTFIFTAVLVIAFNSHLVLMSLILIWPSLFIRIGMVSVTPLFVLSILSLLIPAIILFRRFPISGIEFLRSIVTGSVSPRALRYALELENGLSFPVPDGDAEITDFLSGQYINKVVKEVRKEPKLLKRLFPGWKRLVAMVLVLIVSSGISLLRFDLLSDIYTALRTGLPAEMISLDTPIEFEKLEAKIIPPAYLDSESPVKTNLLKTKKIQVLQGSSVQVRGEYSGIKSGKLILSTGKGVEYFPATIESQKMFDVTFLAPMKGSFAFEFVMAGAGEGARIQKSRVFRIEAAADQPPDIVIEAPKKEHDVLYGQPFGITYNAKDDYGILEIILFHRDPEIGGAYHEEIVARFPKEPKRAYRSSYIWNPILREGKKVSELIYHPYTKRVEYFLEVRDINMFSSDGIARSKVHYVIFKSKVAALKKGTSLIEELIREGKLLLADVDSTRKRTAYGARLKEATDVFTTELRDVLPRSSLVQETNKMISVLRTDDREQIKESLEQYIAFLENYLMVLSFAMESERAEAIFNEISSVSKDIKQGRVDSALRRLAAISKMLEKNFSKELKEIRNLIKDGKRLEARDKLDQLLKKIKKMAADKLKGFRKKFAIAGEVKKKLDELVEVAKKIKEGEEQAKKLTDAGSMKHSKKKQAVLNEKLEGLKKEIGKIGGKYPFLMNALKSHPEAARSYGKLSHQSLEKSQQQRASGYQQQVIQHLEAFTRAVSEQKKRIDEMASGNMENLFPQNFLNRFVFIPKEALYTVPIDFKQKVIDISSERSKNTRSKERFWRDILE